MIKIFFLIWVVLSSKRKKQPCLTFLDFDILQNNCPFLMQAKLKLTLLHFPFLVLYNLPVLKDVEDSVSIFWFRREKISAHAISKPFLKDYITFQREKKCSKKNSRNLKVPLVLSWPAIHPLHKLFLLKRSGSETI